VPGLPGWRAGSTSSKRWARVEVMPLAAPECGVRRIRPPSSAESDQSFRLNPTTQFGVSDHLGEGLAAA
jgi:hypothetical protein